MDLARFLKTRNFYILRHNIIILLRRYKQNQRHTLELDISAKTINIANSDKSSVAVSHRCMKRCNEYWSLVQLSSANILREQSHLWKSACTIFRRRLQFNSIWIAEIKRYTVRDYIMFFILFSRATVNASP